jgi:hypothetical protein
LKAVSALNRLANIAFARLTICRARGLAGEATDKNAD